VGLLREIGAGSRKFAAVGDCRAAVAARIAFDFEEVVAVAVEGPGVAEGVKRAFGAAVAPLLSTRQPQRLALFGASASASGSAGADGALLEGAVRGADTVFVGRDYLIALASMGGRSSPQAKDRKERLGLAGKGAAAAQQLTGAQGLSACCLGLSPGAVVVSEGGELPAACSLDGGLDLVGSVDLGSLHGHAAAAPVFVYQRVLMPGETDDVVAPAAAAPAAAAAVAPTARPAAAEPSPTRLRSRRDLALDAPAAADGAKAAAKGEVPGLSSPQDSALMRRKRRSPVPDDTPDFALGADPLLDPLDTGSTAKTIAF
jgi:hypothetical protein